MRKITQLTALLIVLFASALAGCSQEDETLDELVKSTELCVPFETGEDKDGDKTNGPG